MVPLVIFFAFAEIVNWLFLLLDELFYPSYRKVEIKSPVFIVGMPRTGSTFLHNLLYNDRERFTSMKLWEMLFCPSVIQKKFALRLRSSPRFMNSFVMRKIKALDRMMFKGYRPVHPSGLFHIEEDDFLLTHVCASQTMLFVFPEVRKFQELIHFDERVPAGRKKRIMSFFRKGVQKHMMVYGKERTYLSKCPMHTPKVASIRKEFKGSRFICLFREPPRVISSTIGLLIRFCRIYHAPVDLQSIRERVMAMADHWFVYPVEILTALPPREVFFAAYGRLTRDPERLIGKIYDRFGYSMNDEFRDGIRSELQTAADYKSSRPHSSEKCGLNGDTLENRYGKAYEKLKGLSEDAN